MKKADMDRLKDAYRQYLKLKPTKTEMDVSISKKKKKNNK